MVVRGNYSYSLVFYSDDKGITAKAYSKGGVEFNQDAPTQSNPLGVKGAGEAGATGAPPAVVNAVVDALKPLGISHIDMPLAPLKVWEAIRSARLEKAAR